MIPSITLYRGTDLASANDIVSHGVDTRKAARWNGSAEFWATTNPTDADWHANGHPNSPPAARVEFTVPLSVFQALRQLAPPGFVFYNPADYEFFPASFAVLNLYIAHGTVHVLP